MDEISWGGNNRPVQRRRVRKDGWTEKRKKIFLDHLAATSNVRRSAAEAGIGSNSAYRLRFRDESFRAQWDAALEQGYARIEAMLLERVFDAHPEEPSDGERFAHRMQAMDSSLALTLLKQRDARKQGVARGGKRPGKASIDELRAEIAKWLSGLNKRLGGAG